MVTSLVLQLLGFEEVSHIIVTKNIPEASVLDPNPKVQIIQNARSKGFGENHNCAYKFNKNIWFCVLNPDVIFLNNPFPQLLANGHSDRTGVLAPLVLNSNLNLEDSVRKFPSILSIVCRKLLGISGHYDFGSQHRPFRPEWVAGMFMLFNSVVYEKLGGFDPDYRMYFEDVDICVRTWLSGYEVLVVPQAQIIHDGKRASRNNWLHLKWHILSFIRYLVKFNRCLPKDLVASANRN